MSINNNNDLVRTSPSPSGRGWGGAIFLNIKVFFLYFLIQSISFAQTGRVSGRILFSEKQIPVPYANIAADSGNIQNSADANGFYVLENIPFGRYQISAVALGYGSKSQQVTISSTAEITLNFTLDSTTFDLEEVEIKDRKQNNGITRLRAVEGTAIYEGKKNEVLVIKEIDANTATNNTRELFAKVPGINIWESDAAGVQLGIATRGLNPNRTSEFNMRQNGYDMSADALGYPESYYTPPIDMVERVEIVRGAASLQYGTQFGGLVNFVLKKGSKITPIEISSKNTVGSYGMFTSSNSVGGTYKKINYFTFYQHKTGNGWRPNTQYKVNTGYGALTYNISPRLSISGDIVHMDYLMQQPGGLSDDTFNIHPTQSFRTANWFAINWNLFSVSIDYKINENDKINIRNFGLLAERISLGNIALNYVNRPDDEFATRQLISDQYRNFGSEGRYLKFYKISGKSQTLLVGYRLYRGNTTKKQGLGVGGTGADFQFQNPSNLETYDFKFPGYNAAVFAEHIFNVTDRLSITPGIRYEYIETVSQDQKTGNSLNSARHFPLLGIGVSYVPYAGIEMYGNISQNYKSITFSDTKADNPLTNTVDPNLKDVNGYTSDLGMRGTYKDYLNFDMSLFYMLYNDRIGNYRTKSADGLIPVTNRTNIGTSQSIGTELFGEINFFRLIKLREKIGDLSWYVSTAFQRAEYIKSSILGILGNVVEYAPNMTFRSGITYKLNKFSTTIRYSYTSDQYTDATNALRTQYGENGLIPEYWVMDVSCNYTHKWLIVGAGVNNLTNNIYFTRRALSYPGPGIIPSEPRIFYFTLGFKI